MAFTFQSDNKTQIQNEVEYNLLDSIEFRNYMGSMPVPLGVSESGEKIIRDFSSIPHILISGHTGAGKTAFVKTILSVIISNKTSDDLKLSIYDTKMIDYKPFEGLNHLLFPVTSNLREVLKMLEFFEAESKNRLKIIADAGCRDFKAYNEINIGKESLPEIIFVMDDFTSLYLDKYFTNVLINILRDGRITGIHIIIVTSLSVFSKNIYKEVLSLIPCRICFRVSSRTESRSMLEQSGAEYLYVPGEMIYKFQNDYYKCQSAYATHENIKASFYALKNNSQRMSRLKSEAISLFSDLIPEVHKKLEVSLESKDEFLEDAARLIIKKQKASVGMLQREFRIGFNRASRIMDILAELGVVGPEDSTKPRAILMNLKELELLLCNIDKNEKHDRSAYNSITKKEKNTEDETKVKLRNFNKIYIGGNTLSIKDNEIRYEKEIMTRLGRGTLTPSIPGGAIKGIIYKKPTLTEAGFFTFKIDSNVKIDLARPDLLHVDNNNLSDVIKLEFGIEEDIIISSFIKQIIEDIKVPLITL